MVYTLLFFSLKCSLFHNSNLFGSCIIHILYTVCAKIKKIIPAPKGYESRSCIILYYHPGSYQRVLQKATQRVNHGS